MKGKAGQSARLSRGAASRSGQVTQSRRGLIPKREQATGLRNISTLKKVATGVVPVFFVAFCAAFFAASIFTPTESSDATNVVTANLTAQDYYVKINSSDVSMNLISTPGGGAMTVVSSTVKAATNSPTGYQMYLGMSEYDEEGDEKSAADKLKNGLYLDGDLSRTDGEVITAVSGTATASGISALGDNTWGYAIDKNTLGAPEFWQNEDHSTMSSATPTNDKFAAVQPVGSEDLIQETRGPNVSATTPESSIDFTDPTQYTTATVYFGIRGTMARASGAYSNTIAYTATANTTPVEVISFTPSSYTLPNQYESMSWTDTVTIQTSLYTSMADLGNATVTFTGGPENGTYTCGNPSLATVDNLLTVTCTLPQAYAGTYSVSVGLDKFGVVFDGSFTYNATWNSIYAMQDMTSGYCSSVSEGAERRLTDNRDGKDYLVRKLADGHCWMVESLALTNPTKGYIDQTDSQVSSQIQWSTIAATDDCSGTNSCVYLDPNNPQYGGYYSWYAATAGSGTSSDVNKNAPYSICPKGFKLPTGGSDASTSAFQTLYNTYNARVDATHTIYQLLTDSTGPNLVLGGSRNSTSMYSQGTYGYYWSSTAYSSATYAYYLDLNSSGAVNPAGYYNKYSGFSLRCLAE